MKNQLGVRVESAAFDGSAVEVASLRGREAISRMFELELVLVTTPSASLDEEKLLTNSITIVFERSDATGITVETRRISGIVRHIRDRALSESQHREYLISVVPRAWLASLTTTSDVCMELSIPDILKKKLLDGASLEDGEDVEMRLRESYPVKEFVVQYKESNLDFVCRLAEDQGIHFFFEADESGRDVLVFGDSNSAFKPAAPASSTFRARGESAEVFELEANRQLVTRSFVARDYNYRNPSMDVLGEASIGALGAGRYDEFGPHAKTPAEATFYANIRAQEAAAHSLTFDGKSELPGLRAGSVLVVEGHHRGELELVVTEVEHDFAQSSGAQGGGQERPYENRFRALLKGQTFRPARITPKPVVHGVVTGVVESGAPTDLGAIDDQGRYRVAFMYDSVTGRGDAKASRPLRMAQPSASAGRGFHAPLKAGTEVIITCVNGDPDRPIIAGAVPNPQTPSPVTSANAEKSVWTTNKNSIAIDDAQPRCKISVNGEDHVLQLGEPNGPEKGILLETKESITLRSKTESTWHSKELSLYTEKKTAVVTNSIMSTAGVPTFKSKWEKLEEVAESAAEFAQNAAEKLDKVAEFFTEAKQEAEDKKKRADEALAKTRKKVFEELTKDAEPQPVNQADGTARFETEAEAKERAFNTGIADPDNANLKRKLDAAMMKSAEAAKELEEFEESTSSGQVKKAREEIKGAIDAAEEKLSGAVETYEAHKGKLAKAAETVKALAPAVKKVDALFSKLGSLFSKASHQAIDATVSASQKVSAAVPKASGQRRGDDVGAFKEPYNIQASYNSAALYGWKNAFMFGGKSATIFSANSVSALGRKRVDVKSAQLVEVAAKDVVLSAKKEIDAYSDGTVAIVAKAKGVKVPGDASIMINGQKDVHFVSDDKSVHVKANQNVSIFAQQGNTVVTTKKDLLALAKDGKFEIEAAKGSGKIATKQKLELTSKDDFALLADKKGTIRTKDALKINSKSGHWKTSGEIEVKTKKLIVNAKKIELG